MPLLGLKKRPSEADGQILASITQDLYSKNMELAHTNKMLSLLRQIDSLVLNQLSTTAELAQDICVLLLESGNYLFTAIALSPHRSADDYAVDGIAVADGHSVEEFKGIHITLSDQFINDGPLEVIGLKGPGSRDLSFHLGTYAVSVRKVMDSLGVESLVVSKLQAQQSLLGVLIVGIKSDNDQISDSESDSLLRISSACGVAFDNKFLNAENQRVLKELAHSNQKLKALDQAKDEFISMASHQLRTPLTSIKGYISMILEGDAGDVPEQQKEMLNTAFTSAQRMVYLIADLLNVSRLQTGKFMIEPVDCYLPDVISEELAQLKESAAAKRISLIYDKPKEFPTMKLDETKIRQVIMNFTDNALYYTPAGGEVHIELENKAKSIEFRVVDNGMGVPKLEQHKLFAKFYRAGNARKARPDGTGLGLFMAKKVVVGSGGAILFKSKEGKGSTFGFTFPKK